VDFFTFSRSTLERDPKTDQSHEIRRATHHIMKFMAVSGLHSVVKAVLRPSGSTETIDFVVLVGGLYL
jgi:hypothetical protein